MTLPTLLLLVQCERRKYPMNKKITSTLVAGLLTVTAALAQTWTLRSGDVSLGAGGPGSQDPQVRYSIKSGGALNVSDFANPGSWKFANVCSDILWGAKSKSLDPLSQWINPSGIYHNYQTALFAHSFGVGNIAAVDISLTFVIDDGLGNPGAGINGVYLNGNDLGTHVSGSHSTWNTIHFKNVGVIPNQINWLFLYNLDTGKTASGIQYTATVSAVPEPGTMTALALGAGLAFRRRLR